MKKNLISILATLCVFLPSCNKNLENEIEIENSTSYSVSDESENYESSKNSIINEVTYESKDLSIFKVYDYINEVERYYVLEQRVSESLETDKEGSLKKDARVRFGDILSEDVYKDAKVANSTKGYFSLDSRVFILIYDVNLENKNFDIIAKYRLVVTQDYDKHLDATNAYWNVTQNGISTKYSNFSKDENGEFIIDEDAIVLDQFELLDGKYTEDEILEIQEELNNNNFDKVRKLM